MLGDKLNNLIDTTRGDRLCALGKIYFSVDKDSQEAIIAVMKNREVSSSKIVRALNEEGYAIGKTTLQLARQCILGETSSCRCELAGGNKS